MRRKDKKAISKIFLLVFLVFLLIGAYFVFKSPAFLVKNIIITTDYDVSVNQTLVKILEKIRGENIFLVSEKKLAQDLVSSDIKVKEVEVKKEFPGKLLVNIKSRQALAAIHLASSFFLIDREGLVFAQKEEAGGLPIVNGLQNIGVGSRIDKKNKNILSALDFLSGKEKVIDVLAGEEEAQLQLKGGILVLLPLEQGVETKINSLQLILSRFRIEGKKPTKIDLRFEKPVVTF